MTNPKDDTQPRRPANFPPPHDDGGLAAPPKILLWGMIILFILGIIGTITGIYIFREVLEPAQQVRVMGQLPFMEAFLPDRPAPGDILPTAAPVDPEALDNLLNSPLLNPTQTTAPVIATEEATPTPTPEIEVTEEATPTPTATITVPTAEPTQVNMAPTGSAAETVVLTSANSSQSFPPNALNTGFRRERQTWNNCGPATVTMALSYFGWTRDQIYAASYLKPNREDKNVSPHELVTFVNEQTDLSALTRMGGDLDLLRTLVSNQFPVIVERGHMFEGYDWLGHYQNVIGYSDSQQVFFIYDSFLESDSSNDPTITETYKDVDKHWQEFNRTFIVIYEPSREAHLMRLLGDLSDPIGAAEHAMEIAQKEARADRQNPFAWFNMGTSLTQLGRYQEATNAFDQSLTLGLPWRMLWYQFSPYEAYYAVGRYEDILSYAETNINNGGEYVEETYYWQGKALEKLGRTGEAATAFRTALSHNRLYTAAREALDGLSAS